jgi:hypothetical protein
MPKVLRLVPRRLLNSRFGGLTNQVIGVLIALFAIGAVGGTAVVMVSNASLYAGAPTSVTLMFTVAVPIFGGLAIMLYMIPSRS